MRLSALDFELHDYSSLADKPMSLMLQAQVGPLGRLQPVARSRSRRAEHSSHCSWIDSI